MPPKDSPRMKLVGVGPELIPQAVEDTDDTFAGFPVVAASTLSQDAFCALMYAYPGVGKTTIAGMFADYPDAQDVLIVDCEGGAIAVADKDHVYVVQAGKWSDVDKIVKRLKNTPKEKQRWRTVVFDNLTEILSMYMTSIVGSSPPQIQDYGRATAAMMQFAREVRDLSRYKGINTVLISWEDSRENKSTKRVRQTVALTDKLSTRLPGVVNVVGHITVENNPPHYTRRLSFAATPSNEAKYRRASNDAASKIPLDIWYGIDQNPIVDILRSLYEGVPFPTDQYAKPKRGVVKDAEPQAEDEEEGNPLDALES